MICVVRREISTYASRISKKEWAFSQLNASEIIVVAIANKALGQMLRLNSVSKQATKPFIIKSTA